MEFKDKYTLKYEYNTGKVIVEFNETSLPEILKQFEAFLRGIGFYPHGHLDFIQEEYDDE